MVIDELAREISKLEKSESGRRIFSEDLKRRIVSARSSYDGATTRFCQQVGIRWNQLIRWQEKYESADLGSNVFKKVNVLASREQENNLTVVGPLGLEIRGHPLDIAILIRSLMT